MSNIVNSLVDEKQIISNFEDENPNYLKTQLITYIGNKRALLDFIGNGLLLIKNKLGKNNLDIFDVFSGSGIVSRYFKKHAKYLIVNDLENYAEVINKCYLANKNEIDLKYIESIYKDLRNKIDNNPLQSGIIRKYYSPEDDKNIKIGERVFYTNRNANYIDTARLMIDDIDIDQQHFFLAPLLSEASIHANTSGVFKGFYKCKKTGIGQFGGTNGDALFRIKGDINLPFPVFSNYNCETEIFKEDSNKIAEIVPEVDVAYLDPPYNQHPYGSNYFMLNLILENREPENISHVSGIPDNWKRSSYNKRIKAYNSFKDLVVKLKAKYLLISFNSDGFISLETMLDLLSTIGKVTVLETKYNTFRGSRNLRNRDIHVKEFLYLVEKY